MTGSATQLSWIERALLSSPRRSRAAILALHDVRSAAWLRGLLAGLQRSAEFVPLHVVAGEHWRQAERPEAGVLALTFDDGNTSIRTIVEPVCTELGVPFTTFVCGEVVSGGPAPWFERVGLLVRTVGGRRVAEHLGLAGHAPQGGSKLMSALKNRPLPEVLRQIEELEQAAEVDPDELKSRYMSGEDLSAVATNPLATVGSHTHRHPILANLGQEGQREEIRLGLEAVRRWVPDVSLFAYPNGKSSDYDRGTITELRALGVVAAVTTVQRPIVASDDVMELPRLAVSEGDSALRVQVKWAVPWLSTGDWNERRTRRKVATRS